jgi:ketosteroid isomerase-like protein
MRRSSHSAILVVEDDEHAVAEARGAASVVDQHQREQGVRFGFVELCDGRIVRYRDYFDRQTLAEQLGLH